MFTTGSKLFLGATAASTVGALVWGACNGGAAGVAGVVALAALAIAFAFLAGMNLFTRDGNVLTNTPNPEATGAAQRAGGNSMWPLVTAIGVGGLVIGAVSRPVVFKVSVVVLLAALAEWMIQGFAERASADANYNKSVRQRLLNPLEFPVLGAFVLAVVVYGFSRVMLTSSKLRPARLRARATKRRSTARSARFSPREALVEGGVVELVGPGTEVLVVEVELPGSSAPADAGSGRAVLTPSRTVATRAARSRSTGAWRRGFRRRRPWCRPRRTPT